MSKLITSLVLILALQASNAQDRKTKITGSVADLESKLLINSSEVIPDQQGHFSYDFVIKQPTYVTIETDEKVSVFILPGDHLILKADAKNLLNSIIFSGDRSEINRFLLGEIKQSNKISQYINSNYKRLFSLKETKWLEQIKSLCLPFKNRLHRFISENPLVDPFFIKSQNAMITYGCADLLLKYPGLHGDLTNDTDFKPHPLYYVFLDTLNLNESSLLKVDEYLSFLKSYVEYLSRGNQNTSSDTTFRYYPHFRTILAIIQETFTDPDVYAEMFYTFLKPFIGEHNIRGTEDIIQDFRRLCKNSDYLDQIEKIYQDDLSIRDKCSIENYKTIGPVKLEAFIYTPDDLLPGEQRPAIAFFHGGGWDVGKPQWGNGQCQHFKSQGLVAISFEYRLRSRHDTTPIESIADAKSAIRWMRLHSDKLGIDSQKIVASGFSAGGHLAMCTAMVDGYDEVGEDQSISAAANAMMLWVTPARVFSGWFTNLLQGRAELREFDPDQLIRSGLPPMVFFQGTADNTVPVWTIKEFTAKMKNVGNRCELHIYPDQTHLGWGKNADDVLQKMDEFLISLGYL
jgi:acetyl esterase/lipase